MVTDRRTDRRTFAILESLSRLKTKSDGPKPVIILTNLLVLYFEGLFYCEVRLFMPNLFLCV